MDFGPPGTPQVAQGLSGEIFGAPAVDAPTAKTESCFSSDSLLHFGQAGFAPPRVRNSNWWPHELHRYSNKGIPAV